MPRSPVNQDARQCFSGARCVDLLHPRCFKALGRHHAAAFRTGAASVGTALHITDALAIFCTGVANFRAGAANRCVHRRTHQHDVGCGLADFGTAQHESHMSGFGVFATGIEAVVREGAQALVVTMTAGVYAGLQR